MTNRSLLSFIRYSLFLLLAGCSPTQGGSATGFGNGTVLIGIGLLILLFLVIREVVCWYCKINERIDLLHEQKNLLIDIRDILNDKLPGEKKNFEITINKSAKSESET
jgi:hypothetical protein